ncbi:MAG: methyl-accepting chemotaxis protein [Oscillospiraceae bacterium]|nr:methyl-accepting chemotaxis protein [Oscillospiraceae bacterium]
MKKTHKPKKLSWTITFIIGVIILIVAGGVAGYMQTRIITEIGRHTELNLRYQAKDTAEKGNAALFDGRSVSDLVGSFRAYDTGFALLKDDRGEFAQTGHQLSANEKSQLTEASQANPDGVFDIRLGGTDYIGAANALSNGYEVFVLAPKNEVNAEIIASLIRFAIIFIVAYSIVLVVAYHIGKKTGRPIGVLSAFMRRAGATGDIQCTPEEARLLNSFKSDKDEIGQLIIDCGTFVDHVLLAAQELEALANGDLTVEIRSLSDEDTMAGSLNKMINNLNTLFGDIHNSAVLVAKGSKQIADGASSLAGGASEQSEAIDGLSASIDRIREQTDQNAAVAREAANLSNEIRINAEKGNAQMDHMMQAVTEINDASGQIGKVIKVIDDIAFQTNILALNAAVEAARAGQHGKGFAVVAEEVRNLASKSAEAAKDTGRLIENSVAKANLGLSIATETAQSLKEIVEGINRSAGIIGRIANESDEQLSAIGKLNAGIGQVSQVIQQNSAAAEESAASAEEMSGQSAILEDLIAQFKLKNTLKALGGGGKY